MMAKGARLSMLDPTETAIWELLAPFSRFGTGPDLSRTRRVLGPERAALPKGIVITGSNGKGTVTHLTSDLLTDLGYRVGRFVSPHLLSITERVAINGIPTSLSVFHRAVQTVITRLHAPDHSHVSRFEVLAAAAVQIFYQAQVDVIVWEAGLGGRYDPTRLMPKNLAILTSLALEHTSVLGHTLQDIAAEKAAIAQRDDAAEVVPLLLGPIDSEVHRTLSQAQPTVRYTEAEIETSLGGAHQKINAQIALSAVRQFTAQPGLLPDMRHYAVPCRTEKIQARAPNAPAVYADVAHHPSALRALHRWLESLPKPLVLVFGVSHDRAAPEMLEALPERAHLIYSEAPYKATPAKALSQLRAGSATPRLRDALRDAQAVATPAGTVVVLGGLYLAAAAKALTHGVNTTGLRWE